METRLTQEKCVTYEKELWWYLKLTITLECGSSKFSFFNVRSISIQIFADARSSNNGLGIPCPRLSTLLLIPGFGGKAIGSTSFNQKAFGQQAFIRQSLQSKQPWLRHLVNKRLVSKFLWPSVSRTNGFWPKDTEPRQRLPFGRLKQVEFFTYTCKLHTRKFYCFATITYDDFTCNYNTYKTYYVWH
jgi:hypothetical protein